VTAGFKEASNSSSKYKPQWKRIISTLAVRALCGYLYKYF